MSDVYPEGESYSLGELLLWFSNSTNLDECELAFEEAAFMWLNGLSILWAATPAANPFYDD